MTIETIVTSVALVLMAKIVKSAMVVKVVMFTSASENHGNISTTNAF